MRKLTIFLLFFLLIAGLCNGNNHFTLENIKSLELHTSSFGSGSITKVDFEKRTIRYNIPLGRRPSLDQNIEPPQKASLSKDQWRDFMHGLKRADILNWKKTYMNSKGTDGRQWSIKIEFSDGRMLEYFGHCQYPKHWNIFQKALFQYKK